MYIRRVMFYTEEDTHNITYDSMTVLANTFCVVMPWLCVNSRKENKSSPILKVWDENEMLVSDSHYYYWLRTHSPPPPSPLSDSHLSCSCVSLLGEPETRPPEWSQPWWPGRRHGRSASELRLWSFSVRGHSWSGGEWRAWPPLSATGAKKGLAVWDAAWPPLLANLENNDSKCSTS